MAINVASPDGNSLLKKIRQGIDTKSIDTWAYDADGDFYHTPSQWQGKAWLRPRVTSSGITLTTLPPSNTKLTWEVYGVYHGRFIEMLIVHFHNDFSSASATATPTQGDTVG